MGKMKRARQKFHSVGQKAKEKKEQCEKNSEDCEMEVPSEMYRMQAAPDPTSGIPRGENVFGNINFSSIDLVAQKLPDFDAQSAVTSKTFRGKNLKKKEKLQLRKDIWMSKMDSIQKGRKDLKTRKQKQNTPVVGDLTPMADALPTLELLLKKSTGGLAQRPNDEKPRSIPKEKKRRKQMLQDISLFLDVSKHPLFQENAGVTIRDHLKTKLKMEEL